MIDKTTYKTVADKLGEMQTLASLAEDHVQAVPMVLEDVQVPGAATIAANLITRTTATAANSIEAKYVTPSPAMKAMVVALQQFVTRDFGSVDDFLGAEDLLVTSAFASLSDACGFPISPAYIASPPS